MAEAKRVKLEMSGGLELLFGRQKDFEVDVPIPESGKLTMRELLPWIRENLLQERPELFMTDNSLRPGILCLINDADWELEDTLDYEVQDRDSIAFVSTLHGG